MGRGEGAVRRGGGRVSPPHQKASSCSEWDSRSSVGKALTPFPYVSQLHVTPTRHTYMSHLHATPTCHTYMSHLHATPTWDTPFLSWI